MYDEIHALVVGTVTTGVAAFRPGQHFSPDESSEDDDDEDPRVGTERPGGLVSDHGGDQSDDDTQDMVCFVDL